MGRQVAARRLVDQQSAQLPRRLPEQQPPGQCQHQRWRPSRLFLPPSTLHRQSRRKGFQQEYPKGHRPESPDPLRLSAITGDKVCPDPANARSAQQRPTVPRSHGPRPGLPGGLSFCAHTHHTSPAPEATCSSRARRSAALRITNLQRAEGGPERSGSYNRTQRRSTPAGLISMPIGRGEAMGKPERATALRPHQGHP